MSFVQQHNDIRIGVVYGTKQQRNLKKGKDYVTFYYQFSCIIIFYVSCHSY